MRTALLFAALISVNLTARAEIPWNSDLKAAHQQAQAEGKLLLVHFESDNCVWCDRLEAGAFQSDEVLAAIQQGYVPVKINASTNKKLAEYFKVARFPTDVVVDASGAVHAHQVSPQVPAQFIAMLQEAAVKSSQDSGDAAANVALQTPAQAPLQDSATEPPTPAQSDPPSLATTAASAAAATMPAGIRMPPAAPVKRNDGGAASIAENNFAKPPVAEPADIEPADIEPADIEAAAVKPESPTPPLAIDGYCAVSILDETQWVAGDKQFGAVHLGKLYLFKSDEAQNKFLAEPEKYTPALGGLDVVRFIERQEQVDGTREFGLHHQGQLYFFAGEDSLNRFFESPDAYSLKAREIMRQAMSRSRELR